MHLSMLLREIIQSKKTLSPSDKEYKEEENEEEDEDDISDLINYTCEMIEDKMCVKDILQEIDFMVRYYRPMAPKRVLSVANLPFLFL